MIGVSPVILSHAQTFNNEHTYKVDSSNSSIQKAVVNTTVNLSNGTDNKYDMVVITGENGNYYNIITQYGVTGSIPKSDLTIVKSGTGNKLIKLNETEHVIHVTTVLNVREQPDVHSGLLTTLKKDTNIQVTGQEGEWLQVNINGQIGYVYNDFVGQWTIGNVTIDQAKTNVKNMNVKIHSKNVVSNNSQSTNVERPTVNVKPVVNDHNNRAPQESTSVRPLVAHTSSTPSSARPAVVHTSNKDNIVTKPNTVKPNGNGGEIVNLPQSVQINGNGGTSQNMPNVPQINVNPENQGSGESNQPQGGQPSQGGQNTPAPSQGQGNQPQHQVKPEQPVQQGGQAHKGDVKPSVKPEQPQDGQGNNKGQSGTPEHGQSQAGEQGHKTDVKPQQPNKPSKPVVTMVPVTTEIVSSNGTVLVPSKTVEVEKGKPLDLSYYHKSIKDII